MLTDSDVAMHPNVIIGEGTVVEPGAQIGLPPRGTRPGELPTVIGPGGRIRSGTIIYAGTTLGAEVQTGHGAMIREDNVIGDRCSVGTYAVLEPGNRVGDDTRIHSHCFLEHVTLGRRGFLGPGGVFTDDPPPISPSFQQGLLGGTVFADVAIGGPPPPPPGGETGRCSTPVSWTRSSSPPAPAGTAGSSRTASTRGCRCWWRSRSRTTAWTPRRCA